MALQLNQVRQSADLSSAAPNAKISPEKSPLLEQAPESERSDAFSIPVSEEDNSARRDFNQVQNLRMGGKPNGSGALMLSSGKKSAGADLENLDINLDDELG